MCVFCLFICFETWSQCLAKADLELPENVGVTDTYWPPHPTFFFESCPILWVRIPPSDLIYFRLFFEAWSSDTVTLSERDSTYEFEVKGRHKSIYKDPTVTSKFSRVMMARVWMKVCLLQLGYLDTWCPVGDTVWGGIRRSSPIHQFWSWCFITAIRKLANPQCPSVEGWIHSWFSQSWGGVDWITNALISFMD